MLTEQGQTEGTDELRRKDGPDGGRKRRTGRMNPRSLTVELWNL